MSVILIPFLRTIPDLITRLAIAIWNATMFVLSYIYNLIVSAIENVYSFIRPYISRILVWFLTLCGWFELVTAHNVSLKMRLIGLFATPLTAIFVGHFVESLLPPTIRLPRWYIPIYLMPEVSAQTAMTGVYMVANNVGEIADVGAVGSVTATYELG